MTNKLIHMRVPDKLYKEIKHYVKEDGYRSPQEFSLEAIRNAIQEKRKHEALIELKKQFGSVKNIKRPTKKERDRIFEELANEKPSDIFRKYGFDDKI